MWIFIDDDPARHALLPPGVLWVPSRTILYRLEGMEPDGVSLDYDLPFTGFRDGLHAWDLVRTMFRIPAVIVHSSRRSYCKSVQDNKDILTLMQRVQHDAGIIPMRVRYDDEDQEGWARAWKAAAKIG